MGLQTLSDFNVNVTALFVTAWYVCVLQSLSGVPTLRNLMDYIEHQAPLSTEFFGENTGATGALPF